MSDARRPVAARPDAHLRRPAAGTLQVLKGVDLDVHAGRDRRPDRPVGLGQVAACCTPRACWSAPTPAQVIVDGRRLLAS